MAGILSFSELVNAPGCTDLRRLFDSYQNIHEKLLGGAKQIVLPNLYLSVEKGYDVEEIVSSLTSFLEQKELMDFIGPVPYSLFYLEYSAPADPSFDSLNWLVALISKELNRFGHPFGGVLAIDITAWVQKNALREEKFATFLELMDGLDDETLAVFLDRSGSESSTKRAYQLLNSRMQIEFYRIKLTDPDEGMKIVSDRLRPLGFALDEEAEKALFPVVERIIALPSNQGPLTLKNLAQDIAYSLYSKKEKLKRSISKEDVAPFLPGGEKYRKYVAPSAGGLIGD